MCALGEDPLIGYRDLPADGAMGWKREDRAIDRILPGASPRVILLEAVECADIVVTRPVARSIGVTHPPELLPRATDLSG